MYTDVEGPGLLKQALDFVRLQRTNEGLELSGDFVGRRAGRKADWHADADGDFAEMGEAAVGTLHFPDAVEAHGDDGKAQVFRK
jgi:hypothetical protein